MGTTVLTLLVAFFLLNAKASEGDNWPGRYFPDANAKPLHNGIVMGKPDPNCDDGIHNLEVDYNGSVTLYTCFDNKANYLPNPDVRPIIEHERVPVGYDAPHYCMNETIAYDVKFPTFGGHRPLWPKYGEYNFVPVQRWLHNLEHGAIVMLYHPCANGNEVRYLKDIVRNCLFRHIISANTDLSPERPMALLAWSYRLEMSVFNAELAIQFITKHANKAPEKKIKNGQYSFDLIRPAEKSPTDKDDRFCAKFVG